METVISSIPEGLDMVEVCRAKASNCTNIFIFVIGEIVEFEVLKVGPRPAKYKVSIKDRAEAKLYLVFIDMLVHMG